MALITATSMLGHEGGKELKIHKYVVEEKWDCEVTVECISKWANVDGAVRIVGGRRINDMLLSQGGICVIVKLASLYIVLVYFRLPLSCSLSLLHTVTV